MNASMAIRFIGRISIPTTLWLNVVRLRRREMRIIVGKKASVALGRGCELQIGGRLRVAMTRKVMGTSLIELHDYARLTIEGGAEISDGCFVRIGEGASLTLGDGAFVNSGARISSNTSVTIGRGCMFGFDVVILDDDYHRVVIGGAPRPSQAPIRIGDNVWIGARAMVLKGVTIGPGSIVAAGTVVTEDVPPNSLVGGSPMKVLRSDVSWEG